MTTVAFPCGLCGRLVTLPAHLHKRVNLACSEAGWLLCLPPSAAAEVWRLLDNRDKRALRLASRLACVQSDAYVRRLVVTAADAPAMAAGGLDGLYPNLREVRVVLSSSHQASKRSLAVHRQVLLGVVACCSRLQLLKRITICHMQTHKHGSAQTQEPLLLDAHTWVALVVLLPPWLQTLCLHTNCFQPLRSTNNRSKGGANFGVVAAVRLLAQHCPGISAVIEGEVLLSELLRDDSWPAGRSGPGGTGHRTLIAAACYLQGKLGVTRSCTAPEDQIELLYPAMPAFAANLDHMTSVLINVDITSWGGPSVPACTFLSAAADQLSQLRSLRQLGFTITAAAPRHDAALSGVLRNVVNPDDVALSLLRGALPLAQLHTIHADLCTLQLRHLRLLQQLPALVHLEAHALALQATKPGVAAVSLAGVTYLALGGFTIAPLPALAQAPAAAGAAPAVPATDMAPPSLIVQHFPALQSLTYGYLPARRCLRTPELHEAALSALLQGAISLRSCSITAIALKGADALCSLLSLQHLRLDTPHTAGMLSVLRAVASLQHFQRIGLGPSCCLSSTSNIINASSQLLRVMHNQLSQLASLSLEVEDAALCDLLMQQAPAQLQELELQNSCHVDEQQLAACMRQHQNLLRLSVRGCPRVSQEFMMHLPSNLGRPWLEAHWAASQHDGLQT